MFYSNNHEPIQTRATVRKKKKAWWLWALFPMSAVLAGELPQSEMPVTNKSLQAGTETATASAVKRLYLASELIDYGRANGNAMALIVAAEMQVPFSLNSELLTDARELSGDDALLLAAIEKIAMLEHKGNREGPRHLEGTLKAQQQSVYRFSFRAGEIATVAVISASESAFLLQVQDQNGEFICNSPLLSARQLCRWTPLWEGEFVVNVSNQGNREDRFVMYTN